MILADWAENSLIAPQYARQSAYWASVLCEPEIPEFAEWPMEDADPHYTPEPPICTKTTLRLGRGIASGGLPA